jgi:hypothetical protein
MVTRAGAGEPDVTALNSCRSEGPDLVAAMVLEAFGDASHKACKDGKGLPGNPARFTIAEMHPVYAIEVCKFESVAKCKWSVESA